MPSLARKKTLILAAPREFKGAVISLRYGGETYESYEDKGEIKFKITNFKKFKTSNDKALIVKKGDDFIKVIPFEWKAVYSSMGGLILRGYEY